MAQSRVDIIGRNDCHLTSARTTLGGEIIPSLRLRRSFCRCFSSSRRFAFFPLPESLDCIVPQRKRGVIVGNDQRMIYGCPLINKNGKAARIKTAKDAERVGTPGPGSKSSTTALHRSGQVDKAHPSENAAPPAHTGYQSPLIKVVDSWVNMATGRVFFKPNFASSVRCVLI